MKVPSLSREEIQDLINRKQNQLLSTTSNQPASIDMPPVGFEDVQYNRGVEKTPHPMVIGVEAQLRQNQNVANNNSQTGNMVVPKVDLENPAVVRPEYDDNSRIASPNSEVSVDGSTPPDKLSPIEVLQSGRDSALKQMMATRAMTGKEFNGGKEDKWYINLLKGALNASAPAAASGASAGEVLGAALAGAGANAVSPNMDNRIDRDRAVQKQATTVDMLNQQIGQQLKEQQGQAVIDNYKSLGQDRVADNSRAQTKLQQDADGKVLSGITKVFSNATVFDPEGNVRDKEVDNRFFQLTGSHLPKLEKGSKAEFTSNAKTGEQFMTLYNPNTGEKKTEQIMKTNPDGTKSPLIAYDAVTVSSEEAGKRQDKQIAWDREKTVYEAKTRKDIENMREVINKQTQDKDKTDAIIQVVVGKVMDNNYEYKLAMMDNDNAKATQILEQEVKNALSIYDKNKRSVTKVTK